MDRFNNICSFSTNRPITNDLHILHLALETKEQLITDWKTIYYFRLHYVIEGEGVLRTQSGDFSLQKGDVFFCLPSKPYALQSIKNFRYIYIGCVGERVNATTHKISSQNCVFKDYGELFDVWIKSIEMPEDLLSTYAEGLYLCTISSISKRTLQFESPKKKLQTASMIKSYIDDNFANPDLSLQKICKSLSYNYKYVSKIFKSEFKISFKEYLNTIRINNACALINNGFTVVKDLAFLCGFNDPLYFSKVFKVKTNCSPREYLLDVKKQNANSMY